MSPLSQASATSRLRRLWLPTSCITLLLLGTCLIGRDAYAQTGTASSTTSATAATGTGTTTTTTTKTHHQTHHQKGAAQTSVKGTVASVDATAKSFVVHPAKGDDVTLKVNDKTKYTPKGETWDDVKTDAKVSCSYKNDGTDKWAVSCKILKTGDTGQGPWKKKTVP